MIDPTLSDASLPRFIPLQDVHPAEHLMILAKGDAGIDWVPEETRKHFRTPHTLWPSIRDYFPPRSSSRFASFSALMGVWVSGQVYFSRCAAADQMMGAVLDAR